MIVVGLTGGIGAGKSTVSKLLAERGAAIVDADQIARDLQAPGMPVVREMAERFGDHILDDAGALIRPEVAKIVFSDEQALKDLNGIVHPAMQAEIQRQIDLNADTDRLVVLDFPLLGENPREGLAATIIVDIPYELAVVRAVDRGMDEDDVRKRIDSQISREERLETATHVIDNSGDLEDLERSGEQPLARTEAAADVRAPHRLIQTVSGTVSIIETVPDTVWIGGRVDGQRCEGRTEGSGSSLMSRTGTSGGGVRRYQSRWSSPSAANASSTRSQ